MKTDLGKYDNSWYHPGASTLVRVTWLFVGWVLVRSPLNLSMSFKRFILRLFGAKIGKDVWIKPGVNIKYPWYLEIGDNCWIGEDVWIDNLIQVTIGKNVCISQGALLLTGNHNYKKPTFDLMIGAIVLEDGAWIGAKSVVCPGVTCKSHAILSVGSVATKDLNPYTIYAGNPCQPIRKRMIQA